MSNEVIVQDKQELQPAPNPLAMVADAIQRGTDPATIKALMDLADRYTAAEASKAFNVAFASFRAEAIQIVRAKTVDAGPLNGKKYAELYTVVNAVTPALSKHGLSASWKLTKDEKDWIEVTCSIKHILGHSESVSMGGPPDTGGAKSPIQARASTVSYLERYTLKAICGVSERGDDSDARPPKHMDDALIKALTAKMDACTTMAQWETVWAETAQATKAAGDIDAHEILKANAAATRKELKSAAQHREEAL